MKIDTFFATFSRKPKKNSRTTGAPRTARERSAPAEDGLSTVRRPERPVPAGGRAEAALQPLRAIREGLSSGPP